MTVTEILDLQGLHYQHKEQDNVYTECPACGKENLSINVHTGAYHCWSGGCTEKGNIKMWNENFTPSEAPVRDRTLSEADRAAIVHANSNKAEVIEWAASRSLDSEYCLKIGVGYDIQSRAVVFPFRNDKGEIIGAKFRGTNGDQWIKGEEPLLYCLDAGDLKREKIVVVEGEVDVITLKQFGIPAVGTLGAGKDKGLHLLARVKQVYLGYDMDPAGEAGVAKAVAAIGRYRCRRVSWTAKDPNDMLRDGASREGLVDCLKQAKVLTTDIKSKNAGEALNEFMQSMEKNNRKRLSWGYPRLDSFTKGIGGGMFIGVLAEAGTGKTTFIINAAVNNAIAGTNVGICSLEEHPINEVSPKIAAALVRRNPGSGQFDPQEIEAIQPTLDRIQLYEGDETVDSIIDWVKECYYVHDVKLVFIDYLQLLMTDERDTELVKKTCYAVGKKLVKEMPDLCIVMIIQPKQRQKLMTKDGVVSNEKLDGSDARGGAAINQSVDAMLTIKTVKGHSNITQFEYTKVRGHLRVSKKDWLGQFTQLEYDHNTLRQTEVSQIVYGG